jgi:hypothetical protein
MEMNVDSERGISVVVYCCGHPVFFPPRTEDDEHNCHKVIPRLNTIQIIGDGIITRLRSRNCSEDLYNRTVPRNNTVSQRKIARFLLFCSLATSTCCWPCSRTLSPTRLRPASSSSSSSSSSSRLLAEDLNRVAVLHLERKWRVRLIDAVPVEHKPDEPDCRGWWRREFELKKVV